MPEGSRNTQPPPAGREEPAPAAALPLLAGRFDLLNELGSGASGTVYRARLRDAYRSLPAGSEVAVKFLRQDRMDDESARRSLLQEGRLGLRVQHDNLARIHGIETLELLGLEIVYLVMELIEGTSLRRFLADSGPAVDDLTRRIGADAAAGLHALHRHGVVHRDVKPDNLVLTPDGQIKVVDLGLARAVDGAGPGSPSYGGIAGSVAYAAPEVLQGRPARPESDLYGLGIVLFEVATGRHPFADSTSVDSMIDAHLHSEPPRASHFRPRISALLEQVIAELLHKEPEVRLGKAAELSTILLQGERSRWWRSHEDRAPVLASRRRLRTWRRPADTAFRDRDAESEILDRVLAETRGGHGACVCLTGPEGIGRRRLLDECMGRWLAEHDDLLYLGGEADPEPLTARGLPFGSTLLDHLLGDEPDSPHAEARLMMRLQQVPALPQNEAQSLADALLRPQSLPLEVRADLIARALLALTRNRTVVLRVERAEQLDTGGRLVLRRLAEEAPGRTLLLLLVAGVDGLPHPEEVRHTRVELTGLSKTSFLALGSELFREGAAPEEFLEQAFTALAGSPGNLMEALEHMAQRGELRGASGDYHGVEPGAPFRPAPPHLARFSERVEHLPEEQRFVLQAAAVLGARFPTPDLAALVGQQELQVLETLSLFRGRVIAVQGGEASFRHRDFRLALLRGIPDAVRRRLHRQAAWILEDRGAAPLAVGLHLSRAQEHEACLDPLLQGLEELVAIGSRRTSLRVAGHLRVHLSRVADDDANRRRRLEYLLLTARARTGAMQPAAAEQLLEEALTLSRTLDDRAAHGEALTGLAFLSLDGGRLLAALDLLEQAHVRLAPLEDERGRELAASAHATHGRALGYLGRADDGLRHLQSALAAVPADATELQCNLRLDLARLQALACHFPTALKTFQRVEREAKSATAVLPLVQTRLWLYRGRLRCWLGEDAGVEDLRRAHSQARQLASLRHSARAALYLAERALRRKRQEAALSLLREAFEDATRAGDRLTSTMAAVLLEGLFVQGLVAEEWATPWKDLSAPVEQLGSPSVQAAWLLVQAERHRSEGRPEMERVSLDEALDLERELDLPFWLRLRVLVAGGREAAAQRLVQSIAGRLPSRSLRRRFVTANR